MPLPEFADAVIEFPVFQRKVAVQCISAGAGMGIDTTERFVFFSQVFKNLD